MTKPKTLHGTLERPGSGPVQCADCREFLQAGDKITHTLDMRRMWHTSCFEANLTPFKHWPKSARIWGNSWGPRLEYILTNSLRLLLDARALPPRVAQAPV